MKYDVVLVYPLTEYFDFIAGFRELPQNLMAIAGPCLERGYSVKIVDQRVDKDWKGTLDRLLADSPLVVGLGTRTGPQLKHTIETAQWIKSKYPDQTIVVGGPHVTICTEQMSRSEYVDFAIPYEGDAIFADLVDALARASSPDDVQGVAFTKNGEYVYTGMRPPFDLDTLQPLPYQLVDLKNYPTSMEGKPSITFFPDRGCPNKCAFCNVNEYYPDRCIRYMSAENVIKNFEVFRSLGYKIVSIGDGNFLGPRKRLEKIVAYLEGLGGSLHVKCSARIDDINRFGLEFLKRLNACGFTAFQIGVESGSNRILEVMNKRITVDDVIAASEILRQTGIVPLYSFMGGVPDETVEDGQKTLDLMLRLAESNPKARLTNMQLFRLFPGETKFWHLANQKHHLQLPTTMEGWYTLFPFGHPWLSEDDLRLFKKWNQLSYFVSASNIDELISNKILRILLRIYARYVQLRIKSGAYAFMPELKLISLLGG